MKFRKYHRILYVFIFLGIFSGAYSQDEAPNAENNTIEQTNENSNRINRNQLSAELLKDSETISGLVRDIRKYRDESSDSEAQRKIKHKRITKLLKTTNKSFKNSGIEFFATRVTAVEKSVILTRSGTANYKTWLDSLRTDQRDRFLLESSGVGHYNSLLLLESFKNQYSNSCRNCFQDGKSYIIQYVIADKAANFSGIYVENENGSISSISTIIVKIVTDEDEVLKSKIGTIQQISGKLKHIFYNGSSEETVMLFLE